MVKTCLIAEYDPWEINLLSVFAERFGFLVTQAYQGQDIVKLARSIQPDVILLEQSLPGNPSPQDILHKLGENLETRDIPVIITYASGYALVAETLREAVCFLKKPATYDDFVQAMADAGLAN